MQIRFLLISIESTFSTFFYFRQAQRVPAEKTLENGLDESGYRMKLQSSYARTSYTLLLLRCNVMQLKIEVNIEILSATSR
jgi:hypothetical protein